MTCAFCGATSGSRHDFATQQTRCPQCGRDRGEQQRDVEAYLSARRAIDARAARDQRKRAEKDQT